MRNLLPSLLLAAGLLNGAAQPAFQPDQQYTNELRNFRAQLQSQQPRLATNELNQLAATLARSNRLARIIPELLFSASPDFTNAAALLKEFPGKIDDLRRHGQPMLYCAVNDGAMVVFDFLLEQKANPDATTYNETALAQAIQYRRWDMAHKLIQAGASVTLTNNYGRNAAATFFDYWYPGNSGTPPPNDLVPLMLKRGLDPFAVSRPESTGSILEECLNRESGYRGSPSAGTVFYGDLLLTNNASPARRTPLGDTALHLAAYWANTNAIEFLLQAGFSIDQTNSAGLTPLQAIVGMGQAGAQVIYPFRNARSSIPAGGRFIARPPLTMSDYLLSRNATLDVFSAAGLGRTNELAALLAKNTALANARDSFGRTPLHYAIVNAGSFVGGAYYSGFGGPMTWSGPMPQGFSVRGGLIPGAPGGAIGGAPVPTNAPPTAITLLLNAGADPSAATTRTVPPLRHSVPLTAGTTAMHLAARSGNTPIMRTLLAARANVKLADADGNTPLHLAARTWQTNALTLLLNARAPLEVTNLASQTPLRAAVESSTAAAVSVLLNAGANTTNGLGTNTLLHLAATRNDVNTLTLLLKHNLPLETPDGSGRTPLHAALVGHAWNTILFLRDEGANLNATNRAGDTALHLLAAQQDDTVHHPPEESSFVQWQRKQLSTATWAGRGLGWLIKSKVINPPPALGWTNTSLSAWLVQHGAKVNATNRAGQTPLHVLCSPPWAQLYQFNQVSNRFASLLSAGARLDLRDTNGLTPLHVAATHASPPLLEYLVQRFPQAVNLPDTQGRTPLHLYCGMLFAHRYNYIQNSNGLVTLLNAGARLDVRDTNGYTPLHLAASNAPPELLAVLAAKSPPSVNIPDAQGRVPLITLLSVPNTDAVRVRVLLRAGANPNGADALGRTPLHLAVMAVSGDRGCVSELLAAGADPNIRDREGRTPLQLVLPVFRNDGHDWYRSEMMILLLTNRADINFADRDGNTPLHQFMMAAATNSQVFSMRTPLLTLLKHGANPGLTNRAGLTPLHIIAKSSLAHYPHTLEFLKDLVAPTNAAFAVQDANGDSPLHLWARSMHDCNLCADRFRAILSNGSNATLTNLLGETPLTIALASGRPWLMRSALAEGVPAEMLVAPDGDGQPLLFRLLASLNLNYLDTQQMLKRLFTNQTLVNLTNRSGDTALHILARSNHSSAARILMEAGADPMRKNARGETPARLATVNSAAAFYICPPGTRFSFYASIRMNDQTDVNRWLDVDPGLASITNKDGITPLMAATDARKTNLVERLLELGAPIDALSAMRLGRLDEFRRLLSNIARPLPISWPFDAVRFGQLEALQELVTAGADIQTSDASGHSLLYRARAAKNQLIVQWLATQGCHETFFDVIAEGDCAKAATFIAADAACVTTPTRDGHLPFIKAVATGKPEMVSLLLEHGAKPDTQTTERWNALHVAAAYDAVEIGQMLLKAGATNSETGSGLTPLQIAAAYGATNMIKLLIENGADVNAAPGGFKNSPLHWAVHMGRPNTARLLLSLGADLNAKNNRNGGETPLALARLPANSNGMGFGVPSEVRQGYPRRNLSDEDRAAIVKLLEEAAPK